MKNLIAFIIFLGLGISFCLDASAQGTASHQLQLPMHVAPSFPGGVSARMKFLAENLQYPQECRDKGIEGMVMVKYVVKKDGTIGDVMIMKSSGYSQFDEEAYRVVTMFPTHEPGQLKGEPIESSLTLPISFKLK